ncbi:uncharacterized protein LOC134204434 [Armigeres subalbatus]|uniref:uncharacterized protein LOC134204434 n=1 Tax=Armigeres subalbatus TaxID=124917 RepID=UPI002ED3CE5A
MVKGNTGYMEHFVANCVAKMQVAAGNCAWNHVQGVNNPADLISKGLLPQQIHENQVWWEGPSWLKLEQECWPIQVTENYKDEAEEEIRRSVAHCAAPERENFGRWYVAKFSSFTDMVRRTAYLLRFIARLRNPIRSPDDPTYLTAEEVKKAEIAVIRCVQREEFEQEWSLLSKMESVGRSSPLRWFNPQLLNDNVIRVGGRLEHSQEADATKHPFVLPARHPLTKLVFQHYHHKLLHAGPQLLLATVRQRYWPLGGRNVARKVVHECLRCFRTKPNPVEQFMGELPAARVTVARPFSKTGVDYFGPVYFRPGPRRTAVKAYVALFVCMCTKAVHLELVTDLSTDRFLQAFRRFIARRGRCTDVYSDNGTNFVGARNQLKKLFELLRSEDHRKRIMKDCSEDGINWHFIPPKAPHFGGLWEAAVRSAKLHLLKVLGEVVVSYEDLCTLLAQVESCLNSRPLTPMSDDPTDLEALTPGHFLIGASLHQIPDPDYSEVPMNRLEKHQLIQQKLQLFWKRWRTEYLSQMQGRVKRWKLAVPITVGKLVVVREDNTPPLQWKLGRIQEAHPGADGVVRVVTLKTASGLAKRAVEKLCILPHRANHLRRRRS